MSLSRCELVLWTRRPQDETSVRAPICLPTLGLGAPAHAYALASPLADIFPASGFAAQGKKACVCGEMSEELDLRGLKCPLPALMTRKKLAALPAGETLLVLASDPLSVVDIPHMCTQEGHALLESVAASGHHRFLIRRG